MDKEKTNKNKFPVPWIIYLVWTGFVVVYFVIAIPIRENISGSGQNILIFRGQ
jgi:uncharacterized membrane protein YhaH (DUF805 family)